MQMKRFHMMILYVRSTDKTVKEGGDGLGMVEI